MSGDDRINRKNRDFFRNKVFFDIIKTRMSMTMSIMIYSNFRYSFYTSRCRRRSHEQD